MRPTRLLHGILALATSCGIAACTGDTTGTEPEELDISGVWTATLDGTVFNNEDGTGQTTTLTLTLTQSGADVTGTERVVDTRGRSATASVSGTVSGNTMIFSGPDIDPQCEQRTVHRGARFTGNGPGSAMQAHVTAPATANCHALDTSLDYAKQ